MDISYFQKINNTYGSKSRQETDLYLLNRHVDERFADGIDYHIVKRNGEPFELLIIKDTDNNTFKKKIKSKNSVPFNLGDYIEWNGQTWIVTLLDPDDKTYHSGYMYLCTTALHWQNKKGEVIERWAYSEDFTKYSSGVSSNNSMTVGDNQYGLTLPIDDETKQLRRDMRFVIDFEDVEQPEVYRLTNRKVMINNNTYFGRGGTMIATMSYDSFNKSSDVKVDIGDGKTVWVCDYTSPSPAPAEPITPSGSIAATIVGDDEIEIGFKSTYTATITDENGNNISWSDDYTWNIVCDYDVDMTINGDKIKLLIEDEMALDESVKIEVLHNGTVIGTKIVSIVSAI